jgi:hypothetical protein
MGVVARAKPPHNLIDETFLDAFASGLQPRAQHDERLSMN